MKKNTKTIEFKFERKIPASPGEVFDGWLNPKIPSNPWDKLRLNPKVEARADLCRRLGRTSEARASYERAIALTCQEPERRCG